MVSKIGLSLTICICLMLAASAFAQTVEPNISFGMKIPRSIPPEVIDMSWARDGPSGPAEGKEIQVFILWGAFGREGYWLSRYLPQDVRSGQTGALMYEDGSWQPLRPVGVRHGLEITFAMKMAEIMGEETVGVIVVSGPRDEVLSKAIQAMKAAPCRFVALVKLYGKGELVVDESFRDRLDSPDLPDMDMSQKFTLESSNLDRIEAVYDKGFHLCEQVLKAMNSVEKEN